MFDFPEQNTEVVKTDKQTIGKKKRKNEFLSLRIHCLGHSLLHDRSQCSGNFLFFVFYLFLCLAFLVNLTETKQVGVGKFHFVQKSHAANEVPERSFKPSSPFSTALETLQKQIG